MTEEVEEVLDRPEERPPGSILRIDAYETATATVIEIQRPGIMDTLDAIIQELEQTVVSAPNRPEEQALVRRIAAEVEDLKAILTSLEGISASMEELKARREKEQEELLRKTLEAMNQHLKELQKPQTVKDKLRHAWQEYKDLWR